MKFHYTRLPFRVSGCWPAAEDGALVMNAHQALSPEVTEETPEGKYVGQDVYEAFPVMVEGDDKNVIALLFNQLAAKQLTDLLNRLAATPLPAVDQYATVPYYRLRDTHVALGDDRQSLIVRDAADAGKKFDGVMFNLVEAYQILDRHGAVLVTVFSKDEQIRIHKAMQANFAIPVPKILKSQKHYAERDPEALLPEYEYHVEAMTAEGLHSKSDIAGELAWRDREINIRRAAHYQLVQQLIHTHNLHLEPSAEMLLVKGDYRDVHQFVAMFSEQHGRIPSYTELWEAARATTPATFVRRPSMSAALARDPDDLAGTKHMRQGLKKLLATNGQPYVPSDHIQPDSKD